MTKRKRQYNTVTTSTFERNIAHYTAAGNYDAADAIARLAHEVGAPIDQAAIDADVREKRALYRHLEHGGSMLNIENCEVCNGS